LHHEFLTGAYRRELRHVWEIGLSRWLRRICRDKGVPLAHTGPYEELVTARFQRALDAIPLGTRVADPRMAVLDGPHRTALAHIRRDFLVTQCDKASRNFAFICKTRASQLLLEDLNMQSSNHQVYIPYSVQDSAVVKRHLQGIVRGFGLALTPANDVLPYYAGMPKFHKTPPAIRWLTVSPKSVLKPLDQRVHWLCKALKPFMRRCLTRVFNGSGVPNALRPGVPELLNSPEVVTTVKDFNTHSKLVFTEEILRFARTQFGGNVPNRLPQVVTADVTRLYTHIPHQDLKDRVYAFMRTCWGYHPHTPFLRVAADRKPEWLASHPSPSDGPSFFCPTLKCQVYIFTLESAQAAIHAVVDNAVLLSSDRLFCQGVGVPMGASCSPDLCNLFAFAYELEYSGRLASAYAQDLPGVRQRVSFLLANLRFFRRFLDDILMLTFASSVVPLMWDGTSDLPTLPADQEHVSWGEPWWPLHGS
jgi:hypothetical protein